MADHTAIENALDWLNDEAMDAILEQQAGKVEKPVAAPKGPSAGEILRRIRARKAQEAIEAKAEQTVTEEGTFLEEAAKPATDALSGRAEQLRKAIGD